jgi:MFS family permease
MVPEAHRGRLISYYFLSFNLAFALGPYLGMLLINGFNFSILFLVCAGLSLGSFYLTLKLGKRESLALGQEPQRALPFLSRGALPPAVIAFMLNVIWGSIAAFFPLYALKHGVTNPGIFFIFLAAALMLGRVFGGRILDVYDRKKVVAFCLSILALIILPFANSLGMFILIAVMLGTGWAFLYPFLTIQVIEKAGLERGPAMGTFTALADLGAGLGPMLMGLVLEKFSYPVMFGCLILTGGLNLFYFYWAIAKKK